MAVSYTSIVSQTPATASSFTYTSYVVSGTNPVILVLINVNHTADVIPANAVTVSAGLTGTPVEIVTGRSNASLLSIWAIVAPSGTGTITVTLSESRAYQSSAILVNNADQTTPCPLGDAIFTPGDGILTTLVAAPTNLTANNLVVSLGGSGSPNITGLDHTSIFLDVTTLPYTRIGYHAGTGSVSMTYSFAVTSMSLAAVRIVEASAGGSAALTGTASGSITETHIRTGGKTIILTLTGDTYVAAGGTFDAQRQAIINGLDSAQSETNGWDAEVKAKIAVTDVVRTSSTVCTITLDAEAGYNVSATETITATIPGSALTGAVPIVATPTFTVSLGSELAMASGSLAITGIASFFRVGATTWLRYRK